MSLVGQSSDKSVPEPGRKCAVGGIEIERVRSRSVCFGSSINAGKDHASCFVVRMRQRQETSDQSFVA
jgi:hypothetical protein